MITEITKLTDETGGGWVLYDAECRFCVALARRWERALARRNFHLTPLQTEGIRAGLEGGEELLREMRVVTAHGRVFGGAVAVVELARHFWWAAWLGRIANLPLGKRALDAGYQWIADRRHCLGGACAVQPPGAWRVRTALRIGTPSPRDGGAGRGPGRGEIPFRNGPPLPGPLLPRREEREGAGAATPTVSSCASGDSRRGTRLVDALPLVVLPTLAVLATWSAPAWLLMWSVAFALFAGIKWLMWRDANQTAAGGPASGAGVSPASAGVPPAWMFAGEKPAGTAGTAAPLTTAGTAAPLRFHCHEALGAGFWRTLGFLALWPGMETRQFLSRAMREAPPALSEWLGAAFKTVLGAVLVWGMARVALGVSPLAAGWLGMIGVVLFLHFGLFHLASLAWRAAGVDAPPIMRAPLRAGSLSDFWGRRWNLGFSVPARRFLLKPMAARVGQGAATLIVFLVSGLLHELVLSVPARAGYGLPTAYFLTQGAAILFERSAPGRRLGLGGGWRGRCFALLFAAGPAFWLFNPAFVLRVILPFLHAIVAT